MNNPFDDYADQIDADARPCGCDDLDPMLMIWEGIVLAAFFAACIYALPLIIIGVGG